MNRTRSTLSLARVGAGLTAAVLLAIAFPASEALAHARGRHGVCARPHRAHARVVVPAARPRVVTASRVVAVPVRIVSARPRPVAVLVPSPSPPVRVVRRAPLVAIGVNLPGISTAATLPIGN